MNTVWLGAAYRTPVAHRDGSLAYLQAWQLASPLIRALLSNTGLEASDVDHVVMANALYGGGNPARLAALHAGLPESVPALTIDSQCCGGMDAIALAAQMIRSEAADVVIAGGLESWSRAPKRISNPVVGAAQPYQRPPFSPWPDRDPDMLTAAAQLAKTRGISREQQEHFAIESHARAAAYTEQPGLLGMANVHADQYSRKLSKRLCGRLPAVAGEAPYELTAATVASQADAAAVLLLLSDKAVQKLVPAAEPIEFIGALACGADPSQPALAPIDAAKRLLETHATDANDLHAVQIMEAFAVQAMVFIRGLNLDPTLCNRTGGALSRGHPIGASGAIELVNAFHGLQTAPNSARSLCAIAAAGGLGSAVLLERP